MLMIDASEEIIDLHGNSLKYILIDLDSDAFNNIFIALAPNCSDAHKLLVEALVIRAALPLKVIKDSALKGKVAFK